MWRCSCTGRFSGIAAASTACPTCSINVRVCLFSLSITSSLPANCVSSVLYLSAIACSRPFCTSGNVIRLRSCSSSCAICPCESSAASISRSIRYSSTFSKPAFPAPPALAILMALTSVSLRSSYISIERSILFSLFMIFKIF